MAYINLNNYQLNGFLTKKGREFFFTKGFNVAQFGLGDSDINYLTLLNDGFGPNGNAETILGPPLTYTGGTGNFITLPDVGTSYSGNCKINTAIVEIKNHILPGDCVEKTNELITGQPRISFEYINITANNLSRGLDLEIIYSNLPTDVEFTINEVANPNLIFSFPNGNRFIIPKGTGRIILPINSQTSNIVNINGITRLSSYSIEPKLNINLLTTIVFEPGNLNLPTRKIPIIIYSIETPSVNIIPEPGVVNPSNYNNQIIINNNIRFSYGVGLKNLFINGVLLNNIFTNPLPLTPGGSETSLNVGFNQTPIKFTNGLTTFRFVFESIGGNFNSKVIDIFKNNILIATYSLPENIFSFDTPQLNIGFNDNLRIILREQQ